MLNSRELEDFNPLSLLEVNLHEDDYDEEDAVSTENNLANEGLSDDEGCDGGDLETVENSSDGSSYKSNSNHQMKTTNLKSLLCMDLSSVTNVIPFLKKLGFRELFPSTQEQNYRILRLPFLSDVVNERLHCTICDVHMGCSLQMNINKIAHPVLRVLVCGDCYPEELQNNAPQDCCLWCAGKNGQTFRPCSSCNFAFCKACLDLNFPKATLKACVICDEPASLWLHRALCWAVREMLIYLKGRKKQHPSWFEDLSFCCHDPLARPVERDPSRLSIDGNSQDSDGGELEDGQVDETTMDPNKKTVVLMPVPDGEELKEGDKDEPSKLVAVAQPPVETPLTIAQAPKPSVFTKAVVIKSTSTWIKNKIQFIIERIQPMVTRMTDIADEFSETDQFETIERLVEELSSVMSKTVKDISCGNNLIKQELKSTKTFMKSRGLDGSNKKDDESAAEDGNDDRPLSCPPLDTDEPVPSTSGTQLKANIRRASAPEHIQSSISSAPQNFGRYYIIPKDKIVSQSQVGSGEMQVSSPTPTPTPTPQEPGPPPRVRPNILKVRTTTVKVPAPGSQVLTNPLAKRRILKLKSVDKMAVGKEERFIKLVPPPMVQVDLTGTEGDEVQPTESNIVKPAEVKPEEVEEEQVDRPVDAKENNADEPMEVQEDKVSEPEDPKEVDEPVASQESKADEPVDAKEDMVGSDKLNESVKVKTESPNGTPAGTPTTPTSADGERRSARIKNRKSQTNYRKLAEGNMSSPEPDDSPHVPPPAKYPKSIPLSNRLCDMSQEEEGESDSEDRTLGLNGSGEHDTGEKRNHSPSKVGGKRGRTSPAKGQSLKRLKIQVQKNGKVFIVGKAPDPS